MATREAEVLPKDDTNGKSDERPEKKPATALASLDTFGVGFGSSDAFALLQRGGQLLAASSLVPKEYQGNLPNCVIALNMAVRMGADPLMVMQNLYIVHGKPGWSAQFLIATFNQNGRFTALRYETVGTPGTDDRGCRAWAIEKKTGERLTGSLVTIDLAKREGWFARSGSKWQTMPEQMLMYRAATFFIRAYAPELAMGLHTVEELHDVVETEQTRPGHYEVRPDMTTLLAGASVTAANDSPAGSTAPTREEHEARQAASAPSAEPAPTTAPQPPATPPSAEGDQNRFGF
jgi:hypothetical protein